MQYLIVTLPVAHSNSVRICVLLAIHVAFLSNSHQRSSLFGTFGSQKTGPVFVYLMVPPNTGAVGGFSLTTVILTKSTATSE